MTKEEYFEKAVDAFGDDKLDESIDLYYKAIEMDPKNTEAYYNRGSAYCSKKEYDKAIKDFQKVLKIDPKNAEAYSSLKLFH